MSRDISGSDAMAIRYPPEVLVHLRDSPLCVKPPNLPPAEEWMGPPPENSRNGQGNKTNNDRARHNDNGLLEQTNRRPGVDRHVSRNSANPEEIVLGPPRMVFNSATALRNTKLYDNDKAGKDGDARDRFPFRSRINEADTNEQRFRDRDRDSKSNLRRRGEGDQDSDGWSTVKPRKSFGAEGAERFHGRMGERPSPGTPDRLGAERRQREGEDRDNNLERPRRNFGDFSREKEGDDADKLRKNAPNKLRADHPWNRDTVEANQPTPQRERFDRTKSWRERTDDAADAPGEKPRERQYERRWDRDQRQEREPEWFDEPSDDRGQAHTQEDFKKFMEMMKAKTAATKAQAEPPWIQDVLGAPEQVDDGAKPTQKKAPHTIELGTDKFFAAFAKSALEVGGIEVVKENAAPTPIPKSGSRFQNFFTSQEQSRAQPEPSTPAPAPIAERNPLLASSAASPKASPHQDVAERVAFQALLQKLQKQTIQASTPPSAGLTEPPPPHHDFGPKNAVPSPGPFQQYGQDSREDVVRRAPPPAHDIPPPLPQQTPQFPAMRHEQQILLHDLIGQRHPSQNSGGQRTEPPVARPSNPNTEFLVSLMQGGRNVPEPQRNEQLVMRMPQPSRPTQVPPTVERDADFQHERGSSIYPASVRLVNVPGFFDEQPLPPLRQEREPRPQPTHILQRPGQGPPGLMDQMPPANWMQSGGQQMPMPGRPMIPPPGLPGSQRAMPPPPAGYPNFPPMGGFPPDAMSAPPRNMPPPPGFYSGPPPGFIPHPVLPGFQGPESLGFGFDGRAMPPPGAGAPFRRN
ncbi:hypothetical protein F5Y17DRAFT_169567 [Xylariaceae sp. FL0594]|nr:hypothetical protein F5Y17DRAFT_169567 [Xylariaceae sp. FL0594]